MALTDNLVSYWKLDEASGTREDSHGSNDLTDNNTVASATGKLNSGADFEADNSESLSITDGSQSGLDFTGSFSISLWWKAESYAGTDILVSKFELSGLRGFYFGTTTNGTKLACQIDSNDTEVTTTLTAGTWYHLVMVYDSAAQTVEFYKDGSSIGGESSVTAPTNGAADFKIGDGITGVSHFADGIIDEVGIWSRALTSGEVSELYNAGAGLAYPFTNTATSMHTLDALLKKTVSVTHTLDALLKKAVLSSHTLDALLKKTVTNTHTLDAYIQLPVPTLTHTISSYLFKARQQLPKSVLARVTLPNATFLTTWQNIDFRGFAKQLNGGLGECVIDYAVPFDYDGADLREGNRVELVISDADTQLADIEDGTYGAKVIYRGYISLVERNIDGQSERVKVHLLGDYTLLALDVLKNGTQTTLYSVDPAGLTTTSGDLEPADVGLMARTIIDRFNAEHGTGRVYYDPGDVPDTGNDATYVFNQKTYREALDALKSLAPSNVYWYVDETGRFTFKAASTTPDHTFVFGRHFSKVYVERSLEKVRNAVLVWNGDAVYKQYTDAASISLYGRRTERVNDYGISDVDAADAFGAKFLAENKEPGLKLICTIIDNNNAPGLGYDIETIQPGDTCSLQGFSSTLSDIFRDNMLITRVHYTLDSVEIEVELTKSGLVDVQARQSRDIADIGSGGLGVPATYS